MNTPIHVFGYSALERIAEAPKFNKWMYRTIRPFLSGHLLEVGSGIGNISAQAIEDGKSITLSDYDSHYVEFLRNKFSNSPYVKGIIELDLAKPNFQKEYANYYEYYDSIFLLNVLEHIENDVAAVSNLQFLLRPGGSLIILVPSYPFLYSKMDQLLGHYKRYTRSTLKLVIQENNLHIKKAFHFNFLGIAGWYWNKIFKQAEISEQKMSLFNKLVPIAKLIDYSVGHQIGLSTIVVACKPKH